MVRTAIQSAIEPSHHFHDQEEPFYLYPRLPSEKPDFTDRIIFFFSSQLFQPAELYRTSSLVYQTQIANRFQIIIPFREEEYIIVH